MIDFNLRRTVCIFAVTELIPTVLSMYKCVMNDFHCNLLTFRKTGLFGMGEDFCFSFLKR